MTSNYGPGVGPGVGTEFFRANPQSQQFVAMISALYKSTAPLYDPDTALLRDPNAWGKVMSDDRFRAFIAQRLAKVARIQYVIEPASDDPQDIAAAAVIEPFIRGIPTLTSARRHLAKFAFWGRSHLWIEGRREWRVAGKSEAFPEGLLAEWWTPTYLRPLDKRQIIYKPEKRGTPPNETVHVSTWLGTIDAGIHKEMENPECLITCVYDDEVERLGYGRGLLETLYHIYWIKGIVRRIGLSGLEKWAHGIIAARVDSAARAGTDDDTAELAQTFLDTLQAMRSDGAIVVDKNDELQVLTVGSSGQDATHRWLEYCDDGAAQLCLSAVRPMGGGEGGAYKQAETENKSTEDLLDCDREMIDEQITRSLLGLWMDLNAANMVSIGLGAARCPIFRSRGMKEEDPEKVVRVLQGAQQVGMQISVDDAHRRTGIKRPHPGELTLETPAPPDPFAGMNGGDTSEDIDNPRTAPQGKTHGPDGTFQRRLSALRALLSGR